MSLIAQAKLSPTIFYIKGESRKAEIGRN